MITSKRETDTILRYKLTSGDSVYLYQLDRDICQEVEAKIL